MRLAGESIRKCRVGRKEKNQPRSTCMERTKWRNWKTKWNVINFADVPELVRFLLQDSSSIPAVCNFLTAFRSLVRISQVTSLSEFEPAYCGSFTPHLLIWFWSALQKYKARGTRRLVAFCIAIIPTLAITSPPATWFIVYCSHVRAFANTSSED